MNLNTIDYSMHRKNSNTFKDCYDEINKELKIHSNARLEVYSSLGTDHALFRQNSS
jgi:hypothetical protein